MPQRTAVTCSSLLAGYAHNALQIAQREGVLLNGFTLSVILSTCACLALIIEGLSAEYNNCKVQFSWKHLGWSISPGYHLCMGCLQVGGRGVGGCNGRWFF